jgi:hypothetical protein
VQDSCTVTDKVLDDSTLFAGDGLTLGKLFLGDEVVFLAVLFQTMGKVYCISRCIMTAGTYMNHPIRPNKL